MNTRQWMQRAGAAGVLLASTVGAGSAWAYTAPTTTPPGITLVDVSKLMDAGTPQYLWRRIGDAEGKPLYTSDADQPGKSNCAGECAKEFMPFAAPSGAKASGDWSVIARADGVKQWAYQGKPLYRYSGEDPRGEPQGARFQLKEDPAWHDPASKTYSPKTGWRRAAFTPEQTLQMPASVELAAVATAGGVAFINPTTRMTIYAASASRKLPREWQPVRAATLAIPIGGFTIVTRKDDTTRQWAYQGEALYTYAGDNAPGEANGLAAGNKDIHAALAYRDFTPPGVTFAQYQGRGTLMTTAKGQTLYTVTRFHATYGGLEAIGGYTISYNEVKAQGSVGCEGDCVETWTPVLAAANAQASGFWELVTRANGSKQWAYKGSPVYSYIGDKKPGEVEGTNRYVIAYGGPDGKMTYADAGGDPKSPPHKLGNLNMADAIGMKPGETPLYVAGQGYIATRAEGGRNSVGAPPPEDAAKTGGKPAPVVDAGNGTGGTERLPDHGAGFYWHTVQLFGIVN